MALLTRKTQSEPDVDVELTADERRAIAALKRLANKWPKSLWIFSGSGSIMKVGPNGEKMKTASDGIDPEFKVGSIPSRMHIDGGDW